LLSGSLVAQARLKLEPVLVSASLGRDFNKPCTYM